jgi:hypothetical protein
MSSLRTGCGAKKRVAERYPPARPHFKMIESHARGEAWGTRLKAMPWRMLMDVKYLRVPAQLLLRCDASRGY